MLPKKIRNPGLVSIVMIQFHLFSFFKQQPFNIMFSEGGDLNILLLKGAGILQRTNPPEMHACFAPAKFRQLLCMRAAQQLTAEAQKSSQMLSNFIVVSCKLTLTGPKQ